MEGAGEERVGSSGLKEGAGAIGAGCWLWVFHRFRLGRSRECWLVSVTSPSTLHPQLDEVDAGERRQGRI